MPSLRGIASPSSGPLDGAPPDDLDAARARIVHLNAVLSGLRSVGRLIARERDRGRLLSEACRLMVESRGFDACRVILAGDGPPSLAADAGRAEALECFRNLFSRGFVPACVGQVLDGGPLFARKFSDSSCQGCPKEDKYKEPHDTVATAIACEGRIYGVLQVLMPPGLSADPEELGLLSELAEDLALALKGIENRRARKRAEKALAENERVFRLITENMRDTVWLSDMEFRPTWISPSVTRYRGYTLEEFKDLPLKEQLTPASLARVEELSALHLTPENLADPHKEISVCEELEFYRKDGGTFWGDIVFTLLRDGEGRPIGFLGVGRDVTERRKAEESLRASEEKNRFLADILRNSSLPFAEGRPDGSFGLINPALCELTGYSEEELRTINWNLDLTPREWRDNEDRMLAELWETGLPVRYEKEYVKKGGARVPVELLVHLIRDASGRPLNYYAFITDLSERKRLEENLRDRVGQLSKAGEALRVSERKYRSLFENMNEALGVYELVMGPDGEPRDYRVVDANPAFEKHTGVPVELARGQLASALRPNEPAPNVNIHAEVVRTGVPCSFDAYYEPLKRHHRISSFPLGGDLFATVFEDETERRRTEASAKKLNSRLERLTAAVRELSAARDADAIADIVRHAARALAECDGATFVLRDGDMCHYVDEDAIAPLWKGRWFPIERCVSGWTMLNRKCAVIPDITKDPRIPQDAYRSTFVKSLLMVPIRTQKPLGAIGAYWASIHEAAIDEIEILQALADSTAVALENVRAIRDATESEARFRSLVESSTDLITRVSSDFKILYANPAFLSAVCDGPDEAIGKSPDEFGLDPGPMSRIMEKAARVVQTGRTEAHEDAFAGSQGLRFFHTVLIPEKDEEGLVRSILAVTREFTESKKAERALADSETRFRDLVDNIEDVVFQVDLSGRLRFVSPGLEKGYGHSPDELSGMPFENYAWVACALSSSSPPLSADFGALISL